MNARRKFAHRAKSRRFNFKSKARGKPNRTQQAELIFFESYFRPTNGTNDTRIEILETPNIVNDGCSQPRRPLHLFFS
jgi:hypothetical protein